MADTETQASTGASESDFGKGFLYPLALFVGHAMHLGDMLRDYEKMRESHPDNFTADSAASLWLSGAGDHLFEFDPDQAPEILRDGCRALRDEVLAKRVPMRNEDEIGVEGAWRLVREAKELFFAIDEINGAEPTKAQWD